MRRLFADTFFYIALLNRGDESHQQALSIESGLQNNFLNQTNKSQNLLFSLGNQT